MSELKLPIKYDSNTKTVTVKLDDLIELVNKPERIVVKEGKIIKLD